MARLPVEPDWPKAFLVLHVLSRYLALLALYLWMRIPGRDARVSLALTVLLAASITLTRDTRVGLHTMLADYFEHTSVANS